MKDENLVQLAFNYMMQGFFKRTEDLRNKVVEGLRKIPEVEVRDVTPTVPLGRNLSLTVSHEGKTCQVRFPCIDGTTCRPKGYRDYEPYFIEVDETLFDDISRLAEKIRYAELMHDCLTDMSIQEIKSEFPTLATAVDRAASNSRRTIENERERLAGLYRSVEDFLASHPRP